MTALAGRCRPSELVTTSGSLVSLSPCLYCHFFYYFYGGSSDPTGLLTTEGIGIGSTLGDLKGAYDPAKIEIEEAFFDPGQGFWSYDLQPWTGLWGFATGQGDADTITSINGGRGCGE